MSTHWFLQFSSVAQSCPTLCDPINRSTPGLPVHHQLPEFTQTHVHRVSDAIQPSHPWLSPAPPSPNPSQHQSLFQWVNSSHEVAKVWSFSFTISPSKKHPGLISFRMDLLDLLVVQGTLKSLLQHHSSKVLLALHKNHFLGSLMATILLSPALSVLIFLVGLLIIPSCMINFLGYEDTEHSLVAPSLFSFLSLFVKDAMLSLLKRIYLFDCRS